MRIDEFLLARIAEDEAVARDAVPGPWEWEPPSGGDWAMYDQSLISRGAQDEDGDPKIVLYGWGYDASGIQAEDADRAHIARWHPGRVLAECAAKRAIVEQHRPDIGHLVVYDHRDREAAEAEGRETMPVIASVPQNPVCLRDLAAIYADHPDYRPEWAA